MSARALLVACLTVMSSSVAGCGDGADIGAQCGQGIGCRAELQCLHQVCVPRCQETLECGDGFVCNGAGTCERVESNLGDACLREQDCGPGHICLLETFDRDGDGWLGGSCAQESPGMITGNQCVDDGDCRNEICTNGLCTQLCIEDRDCPSPFQCAIIIRRIVDAEAAFQGCYPQR